MDISSYIPSITVADPGRATTPPFLGHRTGSLAHFNLNNTSILTHRSREEVHRQYENDKMGLWCLQRKIGLHKTMSHCHYIALSSSQVA